MCSKDHIFWKKEIVQITSKSLKAPQGFWLWLWSLMALNHTSMSVLIKWTSTFPYGPLTPGANGSLIFLAFRKAKRNSFTTKIFENRRTINKIHHFSWGAFSTSNNGKTVKTSEGVSPFHRVSPAPLPHPHLTKAALADSKLLRWRRSSSCALFPEKKKLERFLKSCCQHLQRGDD